MKNWKTIAVQPNISMEHAMAKLDQGGLGIVLVIDEKDALIGTVTDGDIRRALLRKLPISVPVAEIMCRTPQVGEGHWSINKMRAVMADSRITQLPVVDARGRVIGIETLHDALTKKSYSNPVFLMAGGFGKRLHPLTNDCPKPMLKVGNTPILELILQSFIEAGFYHFYISTHYLPEVITEYFGDGSKWNVHINYVHEKEPLGTAGALGLLPRKEINQPIIVMNGDLLTQVNYLRMLDFHNQCGSDATVCVREYEHQIPYGVIQYDGNQITRIVEKPVERYFINAGMYVLSPELVYGVAAEQHLDMPQLLERAISAGSKINMFPVHETWLDIGRMDDFSKAQQLAAKI